VAAWRILRVRLTSGSDPSSITGPGNLRTEPVDGFPFVSTSISNFRDEENF
jgi:hypothetical protein